MNAFFKTYSDETEDSLGDVQERIRKSVKSNCALENTHRGKAIQMFLLQQKILITG